MGIRPKHPVIAEGLKLVQKTFKPRFYIEWCCVALFQYTKKWAVDEGLIEVEGKRGYFVKNGRTSNNSGSNIPASSTGVAEVEISSQNPATLTVLQYARHPRYSPTLRSESVWINFDSSGEVLFAHIPSHTHYIEQIIMNLYKEIVEDSPLLWKGMKNYPVQKFNTTWWWNFKTVKHRESDEIDLKSGELPLGENVSTINENVSTINEKSSSSTAQTQVIGDVLNGEMSAEEVVKEWYYNFPPYFANQLNDIGYFVCSIL